MRVPSNLAVRGSGGVLLLASVLSLVPLVAVADWQTSGRFFYRDKEQDLSGFTGGTVDLPARHVDVEIQDANSSAVLASGATDGTGAYSIAVTDAQVRDVRVRFLTSSGNTPGLFFEVQNDQIARQVYSVVSASVNGHLPSADVDFGDLTAMPQQGGEAFNVYDVTLNGQNLVKALNGGSWPTVPLVIFWWSSSGDGTFYRSNDETIHLVGDEGYDDTVIAHEHAHYVSHNFSNDDSPGGAHFLGDNHQDLRLAWSEGYATYFGSQARLQAAAGPGPTYYIDTDGSGSLDFSYEFEGPSIAAIGGASEMTVQALLWDIVDNAGTPDDSPGVDDDLVIDRSEINIWEVTANYFTMPGVAFISLEDFWDGWFRPGPGHDRQAEMMATFDALTVEYWEDVLENDDVMMDAGPISIDGSPHKHTFYPAGDLDYVWFPADSGQTFSLETTDLISDANTTLSVFDSLSTLLGQNDNRIVGDRTSRILFTAPHTGRFFTQAQHTPSDVGVYGTYNIRVLMGSASTVTLSKIGGITASTANGRGVCWADIDNDDLYDLYVCNVGGPNALYRNQGGGAFTEEAAARGINMSTDSEGACFGDYDNDGDQDLYVATVDNDDVLWANQLVETGTPDFLNVMVASGITDAGSGRTANWVDVNRDGYLDLFVANVSGETCKLWMNDGDGTFSDSTAMANLQVSGVITSCWADLDSDGDDDVFLGVNGGPSKLFENVNGVFSDVTATAGTVGGLNTFGADWGDYDGDGLLDLTVADAGGPNSLYHNLGGWVFEDVSLSANAASPFLCTGSMFFDHDLDGDQDIYTVNFGDPNELYDNVTGLAFSVSGAAGFTTQSRSVAWADYDNDGDPDIYFSSQAANSLFRNNAPPTPWIQVSLRGRTTNRDGIGARIYAMAGGKRQMRHVYSGHGFGSQNSRRVVFGFGPGVSQVDTVVIDWPSGKRTITTELAVNGFFLFDEAGAIAVPQGPLQRPTLHLATPWPNPVTSNLTIAFDVPAHLSGSKVTLDVYAVNGRRVARLIEESMSPGPKRLVWNLSDNRGARVPAGMYLAFVRAGDESQVRKFVVLPGAGGIR
jgi:hypothetical protein